jgi:hypothetical protein
MIESDGYAVFFFPQALEALGEAIKPYLLDGPAGEHVLCTEIDTGGALIEMTLAGNTPDGKRLQLELMVPTAMVRMIVSAHSDGAFGFGPRVAPALMATLRRRRQPPRKRCLRRRKYPTRRRRRHLRSRNRACPSQGDSETTSSHTR